jgi:hypothetical protein
MSERHYGPKVILPRRIKADLVDGAIATTIVLCPLLVGQGLLICAEVIDITVTKKPAAQRPR